MKELTVKELAAYFDHTQLKAYAQKEDFEKLCREADEYGFAMVAINSSPVACCKELLKGTCRCSNQFSFGTDNDRNKGI